MVTAYLVFVGIVFVLTLVVDALMRRPHEDVPEKPVSAKQRRYEEHWQRVLKYEYRDVSH